MVNLSTRMVWLDHGQVKMDGTPTETVLAYQAHYQSKAA